MANLLEQIQACILRSFCPHHSMSFEQFHTKFPQFQEWLNNPASNTSVIVWYLPIFTYTIDCDWWYRFDKYIKSDEGEEYRSLCRHWARYAKLFLENCQHCYCKAEGILEEKYDVDRAFSIAGSGRGEERRKMKRRYPESYGAYLLREARKRKRLVADVDSFQVAPKESQRSS